MNDQEFFDLALKVIGRRASDGEREQMEVLLATRPDLKAQFEEIRDDACLAKKVLPLMEAVESSSGEFPAYTRERLQTKVRQTLVQPQPAPDEAGLELAMDIEFRGWRCGSGSLAATHVDATSRADHPGGDAGHRWPGSGGGQRP